MVTIERKIEGGKLVRVTPVFEGDVLKSVRITGDFFIYPEDSLLKIESSLAGTRMAELEQKLEKICSSKSFECVGFTAGDLYEMLAEAYKAVK